MSPLFRKPNKPDVSAGIFRFRQRSILLRGDGCYFLRIWRNCAEMCGENEEK